MKEKTNLPYERIMTGLLLGIAAFFLFSAPPLIFYIVCIACSFFIIRTELPQLARTKIDYGALALFYIGVPFALGMHLYSNPLYRPLFIVLVALTISNDIGAYVAGSLWGRRLIAPSISPKKSWEGFLGGCVIVLFSLCTITYFFLPHPLPYIFLLGFSIVVAMFATMGDFFESWLKRRAGIKDAGACLPGHGGLLDRFDSLIFVISIGYLCKDYIIPHLFG